MNAVYSQISSVRPVILFHHVMSISIRHQSKQQLIFQRNNQMDTGRFADIVYSFWFGFYFMQNLYQYVSMYFWSLWPF